MHSVPFFVSNVLMIRLHLSVGAKKIWLVRNRISALMVAFTITNGVSFVGYLNDALLVNNSRAVAGKVGRFDRATSRAY